MNEFLYMLLPNSAEWEDMILILTKEEAIEASNKYPKRRVEIFAREENKLGYHPTYKYYKNGILIDGSVY